MASHETVRRVGNRYALQSTLGSGGAGTVWAAEDEVLQRPVAIKAVDVASAVPHEEASDRHQRVLREARAAARLNHPAAVAVFDVFDEDGCAYIVMELVRAPSLETVVERDGPVGVARAAEIGLQLLDALEAAHAKGIVHRDVKPSNVLVPESGTVKLTDFGIATVAGDSRLTASGLVLGSPSYIAPEQAREGTGQAAADLWGLGATLYYTVEGCPPFERAQPVATVQAVLHEEPRAAERAGALAPLITDLLTKNPEERPSTEEVRRRLREVAADGTPAAATRPVEETRPLAAPASADQPPPQGAGGPSWWRRPAIIASVVALLVLAGLAGVGALRDTGDEASVEAPAGDPAPAGEPSADEPTEPDADPPATVEGADGVPAEWTTYTHDLGWSIAHPPDWEIVSRSGNIVDIRDPQSPTYLRVDHTDDPPASAVGAWEELSASFGQRHANYRELRIEPATFRGFDGALWEYTYTDGGLELRAANLGFGTDEFGYALNFQTTATAWDDAQDLHDAFRESFEPATR